MHCIYETAVKVYVCTDIFEKSALLHNKSSTQTFYQFIQCKFFHHAGFVPYEERTPEEGCEEVLRDLEKGAATEAAGETGENTEKEAPETAKERSEEKE